jgi:hypothetical protein
LDALIDDPDNAMRPTAQRVSANLVWTIPGLALVRIITGDYMSTIEYCKD